MSVNTAHANGGVLIHAGETILLFSDNVSMEFAAQDGAIFKGSKQGRIYLTTHRIIFNSKNGKDAMQSFSSPFISMSEVELEQPVFGANYLKGKIRAQQNGNFTGETKFKLSFKSGGCIDFGQALLRAASMAKRNANGMAPPPYEPPGGNWYAAPPPAYTPNPGNYGWLPQNAAFGAPPTDGVYMSDAPPPYPGINPNPPNYAPPSYNQTPFGQGNPQQYGFNGNPGNAAPYPGGNSAPYSGNPAPYPGNPGGNPAPYPGNPGGNPAPYPGNPAGNAAPYPGGNSAPYSGNPAGNAAPYPGGNSAPNAASGSQFPSSYPTLPQQPFGFNSPSAPGMTKEQEAAASAFYDPRNMNSAFVQQQQYDIPPSYDSLNPNNPNNKKTQ